MCAHYSMLVLLATLLAIPSVAEAETIWLTSSRASEWSSYGIQEVTEATVCFGVWPVAPGHTAGIVYTDDAWATVTWDTASWSTNVPNAYGSYDERWCWYEKYASIRYAYEPKPKIWFAIYVDDADGNRTWDNNDGWNYEVQP